jgi:hypothetical protein
MRKIWLIIAALNLFYSSCSTDIDINADWKETTIVYGLLDPTNQVHYIRIHKAFLDPERSAFEIAKIKDSLYYDNLSVEIREQKGSTLIRTFQCERIDTTLLNDGIFASPDLVLYRFTTGARLDSSSTYQLIVTTPGNNVVKSTLEPIGAATSLPFGLPPGGPPPPGFRGINWSSQAANINLRSPRNARMWELTVRIFYDEWNRFTTTPGDTPSIQLKYVDWRAQTNQVIRSVNTNENFQIRLTGRNMFSFMNATIPVDNNVNRRMRGTLFIFDFADDNLNTFLQVNRPSSSLVDIRPTFTNVENGLGIFASRRSAPDRSIINALEGYDAFFSPFFREALGGVGTDSLRTNYPQLNFVP